MSIFNNYTGYKSFDETFEVGEVVQQERSCGFAALAAFYEDSQQKHDELCEKYPNINTDGLTDNELTALLELEGFVYIRSNSEPLLHEHLYILAVPSLANPAGMHYIVCDTRGVNNDITKFKLYDSHKTEVGYYSHEEGGTKLYSWATAFMLLGRYVNEEGK